MLIFPLKKEWYEKIRSGEKRIEYREVKPYWEKRIYSDVKNFLGALFGANIKQEKVSFRRYLELIDNLPLVPKDGIMPNGDTWKSKLRLGYTNRYMTANITKIEVVDGKDTDLHIDTPVYAIHLADVMEC